MITMQEVTFINYALSKISKTSLLASPIDAEDGFVRLVDYMGDDHSVVRAARVSYGEETKGDKADKKLINYLMTHNHGTPFEHISFTFHIKCPLFIARQWFRHRIGSFNEISGRYVEINSQFWKPTNWRVNVNPRNKQDSTEQEWDPKMLEAIDHAYQKTIHQSSETYEWLLANGVAKEQARAVLPLATYTEFYWTVNARSLFNFINLRTSPDAQLEMQNYANIVYDLAKLNAPWTFEAFASNKRK